MFVTINGQLQYLWRAVDQDGDVIDILVQPRRDGRAARRFFRRLLRSQRQEPCRLVTDKLGSYRVAHQALMPGVIHDTTAYANNRAEASHQPTWKGWEPNSTFYWGIKDPPDEGSWAPGEKMGIRTAVGMWTLKTAASTIINVVFTEDTAPLDLEFNKDLMVPATRDAQFAANNVDDNDFITDADIDFHHLPARLAGTLDFVLTGLHELGHGMGLDHVEEAAAVPWQTVMVEGWSETYTPRYPSPDNSRRGRFQ